LSAEYLARVLWDELKTLARQQEAEAAIVEMPTLLYRLLFGEQETDADHPDQGDSPTDCPVILRALHNPLLQAEEYRILYAGRREEADRLFAARLNEGLD
jgi:ribonuclease G